MDFPSSELYQSPDDLGLLSQGFLLYRHGLLHYSARNCTNIVHVDSCKTITSLTQNTSLSQSYNQSKYLDIIWQLTSFYILQRIVYVRFLNYFVTSYTPLSLHLILIFGFILPNKSQYQLHVLITRLQKTQMPPLRHQGVARILGVPIVVTRLSMKIYQLYTDTSFVANYSGHIQL